MMAHDEIEAIEADWELYLPPMVVEHEGQRDHILMPTPRGSGALSFSLRVPAEVQGEVELVVLLYKLAHCECSAATRTPEDTPKLHDRTDMHVELTYGKKLRIMNEGGAVRVPFVISLPPRQAHGIHAREAGGPGHPTGTGAARYPHTAIRVIGRPATVQGSIFVHPELALGLSRHTRYALQVCGVLPSTRSRLLFYTDIRGAFKYRARAKTACGRSVEPDTAPRIERLARALSPCSGRVQPTADELESHALPLLPEALSGDSYVRDAEVQPHDLPGTSAACTMLPQDLDDDDGEAVATTSSHGFTQYELGGNFGARDVNPVDAYFGLESLPAPGICNADGLRFSAHGALAMGLHVDTDTSAAAAGLFWQRPGDGWEIRPGATDTRHARTTTLASAPPSPYSLRDATVSISKTQHFDAQVPDCADPPFDWHSSNSSVASPLSLAARLERPFVDDHEVGFAHAVSSSIAAAGASNTVAAGTGRYLFVDELVSSISTPSKTSLHDAEVALGGAAHSQRELISPSQTLADEMSRLICGPAAPAPHVESRKRARLGATRDAASQLAAAASGHALHYRASRDSLLPGSDPRVAHTIAPPCLSAEERVLNAHNALRELKKYDSI